MKFELEGNEMVTKHVKLPSGQSSGIIYVPKDWKGDKVIVIRCNK